MLKEKTLVLVAGCLVIFLYARAAGGERTSVGGYGGIRPAHACVKKR
jgi:hypothetical protein